MIELIALALSLTDPAPAPAPAASDASTRVQATGSATITIVRAEPIRAETFDVDDPRARIVEREEDGRNIRLHLIEFE